MINILNFLLKNDVVLADFRAKRMMSADEAFSSGEFVVFDGSHNEFYRGTNFEVALNCLTGKESRDAT